MAVHAGLWIDPRVARDTGAMLSVSWESALQVALTLLPLFALLAAVAIFSSALLGGFLLSGKALAPNFRSEEHTSELQSLMRISYAVFCLHKKNRQEVKTEAD